jgi:hypothetical protein
VAEHDRPVTTQVKVDACPEVRRYLIMFVHDAGPRSSSTTS